MLTLLLTTTALAADCERPTSARDVQDALSLAMQHFRDLDEEGFAEKAEAAITALECTSEVVPRSTLAELHRVQGIRAFMAQDAEATVNAFAAARSIEPDYAFPEDLIPSDHPLRQDYHRTDPASGKIQRVGAPRSGTLTFDGLETLERPASFPTVFQRLEGSGAIASTAWLVPSEPVPDYPARRVRSPLEAPLLIAAGTSVGLAAATLGVAAASRAAYDGLDTATAAGQEKLDPLRSRTNALIISSAALGGVGVAVGLGAVGTIVW